MRNYFRIILCLICFPGIAQEYFIRQYRTDAGLPSDIVKGCTQGPLGYFWIATDEGIVKYDGIQFTNYRDAMHSPYVKGFLNTRDGRLLAFGDLDLIEIKNIGDTVYFEPIFPASRVVSDTSISYPKLIYEDKRNDLWISESQSVVKLHNNSIKRYPFDISNRTPQFLRAFTFFEDLQNNLYTCSIQGKVFRYDESSDQFIATGQSFPGNVEFISVFGDELVIGASEGLFISNLLPEGGFELPTLRFNVPTVSFIAPLANKHYFIATRGNRHFVAETITNSISPIPVSIQNINHVFISNENDILLSSNEGLFVIRKNIFQSVNKNVVGFIEAITEYDGDIYYATGNTLYAYDQETHENKIILEIPGGYFQSLHPVKDGIWIANAFQVSLFEDGRIKKQFDFTDLGRFVTAITEDIQGNIWLTIPGSEYAYFIDTNLSLRKIKIPLGREGVINMIRGGQDGIYIASAGKESYLFYKSYRDAVFQNISIPLSLNTISDFTVTDLQIIDSTIWLGTSDGLLKFQNNAIERIPLGENFTRLPVNSIRLHPDNKLLIANAFGMVLIDLESFRFDFFNESSGLLSNTITFRGLFVDSKDAIWVGTSKGLCHSTASLTDLKSTPVPKFTKTLANGRKIIAGNNDVINYGSFISVQVSCITFPNEVTIQYRLLPDSIWRYSSASVLTFSGLKAGTHMLQVRAKKNGPFTWSASAQLPLTIGLPFWNRWWFYVMCLISAGILVAATTFGVNTFNKRRNLALQKLVDERTHELQLRNDELVRLNQEKNNLIGIVAHDLKNPLAQILSLITLIKMTTDSKVDSSQHMDMITQTADRMNQLILKILDVDAIESNTMNVSMELLNLSELCKQAIDRHSKDAINKNISLTSRISSDIFGLADRSYFEQVLDNLLSNAIKFSPRNLNIDFTLYRRGDQVLLEVKDEGPGLTAQDKLKLFGKYQKLSARPTAGETSTGLGLSITRKFVEAMKGEIRCESEPKKGARFIVTLSAGMKHS